MASINSENDTAGLILATVALQIAQGQLGQCEEPKGSNRGPMVNKYLDSVGLQPGYAWCQAFVYWCYHQAALQLQLTNPVIKTGGVQDCWNKTATAHKVPKIAALHNTALLKSGDQFILSFAGNTGHTGIIEKLEGTTLHTIEGNSNTNGSREGYEVVRHTRNINDAAIKGFISYN